MTTILTEHAERAVAGARADGEDLWLPAADAERATGWALKPEGFCRGEVCVPVPPGRAREFADGDINVAALWRPLGLPLARDASSETWALGASAAARSEQLRSLEAPDFSLPDLDGREHSLASQRGNKVLLVSWASW